MDRITVFPFILRIKAYESINKLMDKEDLIKFLKENLKVDIWCDCGCCGSSRVNVSISLCGEEIDSSSDFLPEEN